MFFGYELIGSAESVHLSEKDWEEYAHIYLYIHIHIHNIYIYAVELKICPRFAIF